MLFIILSQPVPAYYHNHQKRKNLLGVFTVISIQYDKLIYIHVSASFNGILAILSELHT